jgi:Zn-dependent protease
MFEDSLAPRTPYDLNFWIGDIPVRVHPYFWLSTELLAWAAILLVSILVHELGHVLMGRYFGSRGHIILTGFCGLAVGSSNLPSRGQRIAVYLAGPAAGFLLAAVVVAISWIYNPGITLFLLGQLIHVLIVPERFGVGDIPPPIVIFIISNLMWVNIFWGLVNLLPIWPLDGGQVSREICETCRGRDGMLHSVQISFFTAVGFALLALVEMLNKKPLFPYFSLGGTLFSVVFFGLLAYNSWQLMQFIRRAGPDLMEQETPREPWEQDADWWKR